MSLPQTEMTPNPDHCIDAMSARDAASQLLASQVLAVQAVSGALDQIEAASAEIAKTLTAGGAVNYVAAGSSGLMALADASELPGTFGIPQDQIRIFMAGGVPVAGHMPGGTEDDISEAGRIAAEFGPSDIVVALSASGSTPFPLEIARLAQAKGLQVIGIANNAGSALLSMAEIAILLPTPPEALAGSTRMGAGTAQKAALNIISTLVGVTLGHVHNGMMVNLLADNTKLRVRAQGIVASIAGVSTERAAQALAGAQGNTKLAVLLAIGGPPETALTLLNHHDGHLRPCIADINAAMLNQT